MIKANPRASKRSRRLHLQSAVESQIVLSFVFAFCGASWLIGACGCGTASAPDSPAPGATTAAPARPAPPAPPIPKIDVHLHIDPAAAEAALAILAENGIAIGLNASGGEPGPALEASRALAQRSQGRLLAYCNLHFSRVAAADWSTYAERALTECKAMGAKGLKIFKALGLGITDASGALVAIDDPRLDVVFDTAGRLGLPVLIHSADPKAFFEPNTPRNERYDELRVHPSWSFYGSAPDGRPWPSWTTLFDQFEARVARHPDTTFIGAHFGNAAEEPERVARMLARYPNYLIDTAARVPEFGRHPAAGMREFFTRFQDRVLFGSDLAVMTDGLTLGSGGERPGTRPEAKIFFDRHWAYFETAAQHMAHPTPIQGRWTIDGVGLPRAVLEKLYFGNAARVFHLQLPLTAPH